MYDHQRLNGMYDVSRLKVLALLVSLFIGMMSFAAAGYAEQFGDADVASFRKIIDSQIEAFHGNDAEAAYEFASPKIKALFPTAEAFMAMVKRSYQPVYSAENYSFEDVEVIDGKIVQPVLIPADGSPPIIALYFMDRQADGSWKIGGCILLKGKSQAI